MYLFTDCIKGDVPLRTTWFLLALSESILCQAACSAALEIVHVAGLVRS